MATPADHSYRDSIALKPIGQSSTFSGARLSPVSRLDVIREWFKPRGFRVEWSSFSWEETIKPHLLLTRALGIVGSVVALNGSEIPCLLL